jgi:hypothetical protein
MMMMLMMNVRGPIKKKRGKFGVGRTIHFSLREFKEDQLRELQTVRHQLVQLCGLKMIFIGQIGHYYTNLC